MRFELKDMKEAVEINSGESGSLKELVKLISMATTAIVIIYFILIFASEYFVRNISVEQENKWFSDFDFTHINFELVDSESTQLKKVKTILSELSQHPTVPKLNYKIFVIKDDDINAFAFPGGSIGVTSGLLAALNENGEATHTNQDERNLAIAFVIGHELGHFKYRHHLKGLSRTISIGLAFSLLTGNSGDLSLINSLLTLLELNHSQEQETESDLFSAQLVFDTYGSTNNIENLFLVLKNKQSENETLSFLNTHPSSNSRIEQLLQFKSSIAE